MKPLINRESLFPGESNVLGTENWKVSVDGYISVLTRLSTAGKTPNKSFYGRKHLVNKDYEISMQTSDTSIFFGL